MEHLKLLHFVGGGGVIAVTILEGSLALSGKGENVILYDPAIPFWDMYTNV